MTLFQVLFLRPEEGEGCRVGRHEKPEVRSLTVGYGVALVHVCVCLIEGGDGKYPPFWQGLSNWSLA